MSSTAAHPSRRRTYGRVMSPSIIVNCVHCGKGGKVILKKDRVTIEKIILLCECSRRTKEGDKIR